MKAVELYIWLFRRQQKEIAIDEFWILNIIINESAHVHLSTFK